MVCQYELQQLACGWLVSVLHCVTVSLAESHRYSKMPLVDISQVWTWKSRHGGSDLALQVQVSVWWLSGVVSSPASRRSSAGEEASSEQPDKSCLSQALHW